MLLPLYPTPSEPRCLEGTYLDLHLHQQQKLTIYSNFIASMDGRIALRHTNHEYVVPKYIANARDWRLYQELAAQSDVMLTSARYFRQLAKGCAQDLLPVGQGKYEDLLAWRREQGLKKQPDVIIFSRSLAIPLRSLSALQRDREIHVFCPEAVCDRQRQQLESQGVRLHLMAVSPAELQPIRTMIHRLGYRSAYMIAGPEVHQTLLREKQLDRLFLTQHLSLLGQHEFHSITTGDFNPCTLTLLSSYFDQKEGQLFMQFQI